MCLIEPNPVIKPSTI